MEDKITDEKLTTPEKPVSIDTGSTITGQTQKPLAISIDSPTKNTTESIYE